MKNQAQKISVRALSPSAGFTLVELMVVVAIIGILAAVAGPRVQQFRARGTQSEAKTNLHAIYLAQAAFQDTMDRFATGLACKGGADGGDNCTGDDGANFTFRTNRGSKYNYSVAADANGAGWAAGAASLQKLLRSRTDKWRVNTNKELCSVDDVTRPTAAEGYTCREAGLTVGDTDGAVAYNGGFDSPN
ncbi:MAG: prepilin-type N-terminal cleavage/methylation domain-containing protein [Proteobacteria bacterium]|nr:prepilin-type N-terminal cleavage/methylation domain-containing protein [Pseudomonadota bacterium]